MPNLSLDHFLFRWRIWHTFFEISAKVKDSLRSSHKKLLKIEVKIIFLMRENIFLCLLYLIQMYEPNYEIPHGTSICTNSMTSQNKIPFTFTFTIFSFKFLRRFFGKLETPKSHSKTNWPLLDTLVFQFFIYLLNRWSLGDFTIMEGTHMEMFNFLWLIWDHYLPLTPARNDWRPWHP